MQTELLAAETLLENGVSLGIRTPFFLRVLGVKHLKIYQPTMGTRIRISKLYLEMQIDDAELIETTQEEAEKLILKHSATHLKIIALCMFRGRYMFTNKILSKFCYKYLAEWLMWQLKPQEITVLSTLILQYSGTADFMNSTRYMRAMKITSPKLGQKTPTS